jgi:glycerophosphoryl diester phosphodiesterase
MIPFRSKSILQVVLSALFALGSCSQSGHERPTDDLFGSDWFLNIAHRGGGDLAPEATLTGFQNAVAVGADVLELDVHSTSDGIIVCMHDSTVDRTTDGTGSIREMTFAQLRQLDAGYHFTPDDGATYPYRGQGVVVPTLQEVLEGFSDQFFIMEIKQADPPIVDPVLATVDEWLEPDQLLLGSATDGILEQIREQRPDILTYYGTGEMILLVTMTEEQEDDYVAPARFAIPPAEVIGEDFMDRVRRFDLQVYPWTVNEASEMEQLITQGVDGIITDDPVTLDAVLRDLDLR